MVRRMQTIGGLLESAFEKATDEKGCRPIAGWRCIEQRAILPLLFGVDPPLARCERFAGTSQAESVFSAAVEARAEVAERLRQLHIG